VLANEGHIDVAMLNAGQISYLTWADCDPEVARGIFEVNFWGPFRVLQAVLPSMRARKTGHIQFVSTIAARVLFPFHEVYTAPKAAFATGLFSMLPILDRDGVTVTVVEPGPVADTDLFTTGSAKNNGTAPDLAAFRNEIFFNAM
jgi:NADP-dependent 3-hydroxy acid dehydrogenase YdfG